MSRLTAGLCAYEVSMHLSGAGGRVMPPIFSTFFSKLSLLRRKSDQKCVSLGAAISTDVERNLWSKIQPSMSAHDDWDVIYESSCKLGTSLG